MRVTVNGTSLWFDVEGSGLVAEGASMRDRPIVLLVHGGPGGFDHTYLKPEFSRLARVAQVVYLDMREHGRSSRTGSVEWDHGLAADDIAEFCDVVGIARPVVLGHSFGGCVVMAYGSRHPGHASGLVLQSTFARFDLDDIVEGFRRIGGDEIAEIVRRSYTDDPSLTAEEWNPVWRLFGPWVPRDVEKSRIRPNLELSAIGGHIMTETDLIGDLSAIDCPTLVSVGDLDPITPVSAARAIVDAMRPGMAVLDVIPGAGHFPWRDAPEHYWPKLESFVTSVAVGL